MTANLNTTIRRSLTACALVLASCLAAGVQHADAGNYTVHQCHGAHGSATSGWSAGWNGFPGGLNACDSGLFSMVSTGKGAGQYLWLSTPTLPAGLKFSSVSFLYDGDLSGGSNAVMNNVRFCTAGTVNFNVCAATAATSLGTASNQVVSLACGFLVQECQRAMFVFNNADGGFHSSAGSYIFRNVSFTVNDSAAPTSWFPYRDGASLGAWPGDTARYWHRGTISGIKTHSYDAESGIASVNVFADGDVDLASTQHSSTCQATLWQPCPLVVDQNNVSINTELLTADSGDGAHSITQRSIDAGGNVEDRTVSLHVDNTAPTTPVDVEIANTTGGWSSTNSFGISWENGSEVEETSTQSGIAGVRVDLMPTSAGQANPDPFTIPVGTTLDGVSATRSSLGGLAVPAAGKWKVRLAVVDKVGNVSDVGDGSGGTPDSDFEIGFDPSPPASPSGQANGWISRDELVGGYDQEWSLTPKPSSVSPICGFAGAISLSPSEDPGTSINIPGDVRKWRLPANLTENNHWVHLRAVTCAGLASTSIEHVEAKVDLTDPEPVVEGVEEGRWYPNGVQLTLGGTDQLSGMAGAPPAFEYDKGAYIDYAVNGETAPTPPRGSSATISIVGEGHKELRFAPVDLAGNRAPDTAVTFGIDATSPVGYLDHPAATDPTLLRAPLGDPLSGINFAQIEIKPASGGGWSQLPTSVAALSSGAEPGKPKNAIASARFPDTKLTEGDYEVRVRAVDQAGNELLTDRDQNGNKLVLRNPMRQAVALSASLFKSKRTCSKKRGVRCVKRHRGKVVFVGGKSNLTVGFNRGAVVQGFLVDSSLRGLLHEPIEIYAQQKGKPEALVGMTSTRSDGSYLFKLKSGVSRNIRVHYPGTSLRRDTSAQVVLGTGAKLKLKVSKRHARTGQSVTFRGTVKSYDGVVPAGGKIVALQFYAAKKWRPAVAIARTDARGRFSVKYRFDGRPVKARIVFRVMAPAEEGWGHATSSSRRITMNLN